MGPGRRVRGEATWAAARDAYLAGSGAAEVCERYGLGLTALRDRARREGWRRRDQADPAPDEIDAALEDEVAALVADPPAPAELAAQAWARAAAALGRGRLRDAQGWTKLWRELTAADRARPDAATTPRADSPDSPDSASKPDSAPDPDSADSSDSLGETDAAGRPHSPHSVHPVSSAHATAPEPPLNRAERRRRARLAAARPRDGP